MFVTSCKTGPRRSGDSLRGDEVGLNTTVGCSHGCKYCFYSHARRKTKMVERRAFFGLAESLARNKTMTYFCDRSDPYQDDPRVTDLMNEALAIFRFYDSPCQVYTKGGRRLLQHIDLFRPFKIPVVQTLSMIDPRDAAFWEPGADTPFGRMEAIRETYSANIETILAVGPVIFASQALEVIAQLRDSIHGLIFCGAVRSPTPFPPPEMTMDAFSRKVDRILGSRRNRIVVRPFEAATWSDVLHVGTADVEANASTIGTIEPWS